MQVVRSDTRASSRLHSVATRLWLAVLAVIVALFAVIGFAAIRSNQVQQESSARLAAMDAKLETAKRWASLAGNATTKIQAGAASSDPAVDALFKDDIAAIIREVSTLQKSIEAMPLSATDKTLFAAVGERRKVVLDSLAKVRALKASDPSAVQAEMAQRFNPAIVQYQKSLSDFADEQERAKQAL